MKVSVLYCGITGEPGEQIAYIDMDLLPNIGAIIRIMNLDDVFEDCIVREIRWDITDKDEPCAVIWAASTEPKP